MRTVEVINPGALTTIQDLGRPGFAHIGVPRSGAADRASLRHANRLVGNPDGAAALETTLVGPRLRVDAAAAVALSGAPLDATAGGVTVPMDTCVALAAGHTLSLGTARNGLRTYIAFAGGINVELTLGSAATDLLTGLGPAPLRGGDVLVLRAAGAAAPPVRPRTDPIRGDQRALHVVLGPRDDWFTAAALGHFTTGTFKVTPNSNRIGLRLSGPRLERRRHDELPSEGLVAGAIQVPPDGAPILLLADHPTTGGYPVIAVVTHNYLPVAAQLRPGEAVRFKLAVSSANP